MENPLRKQIRSIMKDHKKRQMWYRIVTTLAVVVVFVTTYMLILPAITMENKAECGITEHKHDANCYSSHYEKEKELACTTDSLGVHKHTDACYDAEHKLICGYADFVIHEHDASCYDKDGNLVCTIPEHKLHQHTPECYQMQKQLVCTLEESVGHTHTPECYTKHDGRCVQGPGTYSPWHADPRLLAIPTSCRRVAACSPNWDVVSEFCSTSRSCFSLFNAIVVRV